jgi:signal transduction histidine kinase
VLKKVLVFFILIQSYNGYSQNRAYYDSIQKLESTISSSAYLKTILNIPYDIAVSNVKTYENLTRKAVTIATKLNDSSALANSYQLLAIALHFSSKDSEALEATIKSATIFEKIKDFENAGGVYLDLGWRLKNRNLTKAFSYMKNGLKTIENTNLNSIKLIGGYNNFGVLYQYKKQLDSALYFHHKSLTLTKKFNDSIGIPFALSHIAEVHLKQKKFSLAKKYLDSAFFIRNKRNDLYGITDTHLYYGDLYFSKNEFQKAANNYKKGYSLATKNNYFPLKKYTVTQLIKVYDSLKNYQVALQYLNKLSVMKDSVLNTETNSKIAELEIQYQTERKEQEIIRQRLVLKNRNLYIIIVSFAFILILIISIGIYRRQQFKRKQLQREIHLKDALAKIQTQNRLQEQRLRISRDLHDNIGSQLTFIISSIDNLKFITKDANDKLKDKLSSISSFTSDTIFQLRDTIWAMNKSEITIEDLQTRIMSFIEKAKTASENIHFNVDVSVNNEITFTSVNGIHIFRVVQEAINNSIKYAHADKILVKIKENKNTISFSISDNGQGFDKKDITLGNGLMNMEKRIEEVEGKLKITSSKEKGTNINFTINK